MAATDTDRLSWLERMSGLHQGVEILYVVDGYEVSITYDGVESVDSPFWGKTLAEAIDAAMQSCRR